MESCLLAVDGTGLLVRCSNAAARTGMTAPDGTPTGTLTLFAQSLASLTREVSPSHLLVAWDGARAREWRRAICPGYKQNRPEFTGKRPAEGDQVREFLDAAGAAQWSMDEFEADDLLAAACRLSRDRLPGTGVIVASGDKDMLQLAEPLRVWVRPLGAREPLLSAEEIELTWGVAPAWLPRLRALAGDPSDGIKGIRGVGPHIAVRMLALSSGKWPLPPEILPPGQERDSVAAWHSVMDLIHPPVSPEDRDETGLLDIRKTEWLRGNVLPVLERYGMRKMAERVTKGTFW